MDIVCPSKIKFFLGYSGWSKKQLNGEIKSNSWIISAHKNEDIFEDNEDFWKSILENKGGKYKAIANFPLNPSDN